MRRLAVSTISCCEIVWEEQLWKVVLQAALLLCHHQQEMTLMSQYDRTYPEIVALERVGHSLGGWGRWARLADTRLRLAHFHHHRPHKGARKHRVGEATPEATVRPNRGPRDRNAAGLSYRNPVAKAMGKAGIACPSSCHCKDMSLQALRTSLLVMRELQGS